MKEFLLDIECLDPLAEWTSKFNLFDILKISRVEIRHSNMLSWLLNPNENHGLGDSVLRGFIQYVVSSFSDDSDVFDTLLKYTTQRVSDRQEKTSSTTKLSVCTQAESIISHSIRPIRALTIWMNCSRALRMVNTLYR